MAGGRYDRRPGTFLRPLPADALRIMAKGEKEDRSPEFAL
jgi:hypothetical protein